jgi:hypothetical protein
MHDIPAIGYVSTGEPVMDARLLMLQWLIPRSKASGPSAVVIQKTGTSFLATAQTGLRQTPRSARRRATRQAMGFTSTSRAGDVDPHSGVHQGGIRGKQQVKLIGDVAVVTRENHPPRRRHAVIRWMLLAWPSFAASGVYTDWRRDIRRDNSAYSFGPFRRGQSPVLPKKLTRRLETRFYFAFEDIPDEVRQITFGF